jgi:hypothetical protein
MDSTTKMLITTEDMLLTADLQELGALALDWSKLKPDNPEIKRLVRLAVGLNARMTKIQQERNDAYCAAEFQRKEKLKAVADLNSMIMSENNS